MCHTDQWHFNDTNDTCSFFAVSSEVSELGRCHRRRKGSKGREGRVLALRHVYRHLLGAPDDHQLTFSKSETPCESWQACFRISVRGIKRGRGVCFVCWAVSVPRVIAVHRLSRIWLPYRLDRIILVLCYWILLKSLFLQIKNRKRKILMASHVSFGCVVRPYLAIN